MYKLVSATRADEITDSLNLLEENYRIVSTELSLAKGPSGVPLYAVLVRYTEKPRPQPAY